ncbi:hypothetical protein M2T82_09490 [Elizabethkingia ursingii]|uniref:DUF7000 family protein n=1 Tax=Elizabethkingia ursingii TaxID=1756150 RepID=UPI002011EB77|nr:hypothetical protein [Elizabethkingia ursingii]MCL1668291.1 hypothetical protein [Elizabethkingia ursingii]
MKTLNDCIQVYKEQLAKKDIQKAYHGLMKYIMSLKASLSGVYADRFSFGNISFGYMDFTYFPFHNEFLRERKLRFGIVLNHEKMRFELWLMGQNAGVQKAYWELLKNTSWNKDKKKMPRYSILETVLLDTPDFNNLKELTRIIEVQAGHASEAIIKELEQLDIA